VLAAAWSGAAQQVPRELIQYPETILYNGPVLTMDTDRGDFTVAEALAVRSGRILAVGRTAEVLALAGPETRKIDLRGKTVMPGIVDTHNHPNRYAVTRYFKEIPFEYQRELRSLGNIRDWKSKESVLAHVSTAVEKADPAVQWLKVGMARDSRFDSRVADSITRQDLDAIVSDRPLVIMFGEEEGGLVNSKGLELLGTYHGSSMPGLVRDAAGVPNGQIQPQAMFVLLEEIMPLTPSEVLAPVFAKELREQVLPRGTTTFSTRLNATETRAYIQLALEGKMPMRLAYGLEVGRWNPYFERDMKRGVAALPGFGNDRVWLASITVGIPDIAIRDGGWPICSSFPKKTPLPDDIYKDGLCLWDEPGDTTAATVQQLARLGFRVANIHTYGDKGLEKAVDLFEQLGVKGRRFALDHSVMFNPNVIRKSGQLGMYWSVAAQKYGEQAELAKVYGRETIDRYTFPLKELLDAGAKLTYEASARGAPGGESYGQTNAGPFTDMEMFVTRKDREGNVWGLRHALDRQTVLRMMTRWGAEYVLKEDKIGTLEKGKYADLIVLDKNPLDPKLPDEQLSDINVVLTMVEGETVFQASNAGL
jgi:predicted amidohydrolase YtcJ